MSKSGAVFCAQFAQKCEWDWIWFWTFVQLFGLINISQDRCTFILFISPSNVFFSPFHTQAQITILAATPYHPCQPMILTGIRKMGEIWCGRGKMDKTRIGRDVGKMENYCIFETQNMNNFRGSDRWNEITRL